MTDAYILDTAGLMDAQILPFSDIIRLHKSNPPRRVTVRRNEQPVMEVTMPQLTLWPDSPQEPKKPKNAKKTGADYHALARHHGIRWIGVFPKTTWAKTLWECDKGHQWSAVYASIAHHNTGCPHCAGKLPKQAEDYINLAERRGLRWLGDMPRNTRTKTTWVCNEGHQWDATYNNISRGSGCPCCAGLKPKQPTDYHKIANVRGFLWIGEFSSNTMKNTLWRCSDGHEWSATYNNIYSGSGCPYCARCAPKTDADYHEIANQKNLLWTGTLPINTNTKTEWACSIGHKWSARYGDIRAGYGCPYCGGTFPKQPQDYLSLAISRGFEWIGKLPLGVREKTQWKCQDGHEWSATYNNIYSGSGCPYCANERTGERSRLKDINYHELASSRGFKWLGNLPRNNHEKTIWGCSKGHQWEANYNSIHNGNGCPHCANMVNGAKASKPQIAIAEMLDGEINYPCDQFYIDIALPDDMIAIEYDCWYWHKNKQKQDLERAQRLINNGWSVLSVKSNTQLPSLDQLSAAIAELLNSTTYTEIILPDWGGE